MNNKNRYFQIILIQLKGEQYWEIEDDYIQVNYDYLGCERYQYDKYKYIEDLLCDIDKFNDLNK